MVIMEPIPVIINKSVIYAIFFSFQVSWLSYFHGFTLILKSEKSLLYEVFRLNFVLRVNFTLTKEWLHPVKGYSISDEIFALFSATFFIDFTLMKEENSLLKRLKLQSLEV